MRLIDADALLDEAMDRYCKECEKRKGIKNGEYKIVYDIGEAPCRACAIDDMKAELEDAPTIDAVQVIRCKECKNWDTEWQNDWAKNYHYCPLVDGTRNGDWYCADAERREE